MKPLQLPSLLLILILGSLLPACEKVVDVSIPTGEKLLYVDGFITDQPGLQTIRLLQTPAYLDANGPAAIPDATINLTDITTGDVYPFTYQNGNYTYLPAGNDPIGIIGHQYKLSIDYMGARFEALDQLNRVPPVDSITVEYKTESGDRKAGYYAKFFATDIGGGTDYYWIRAFRNGQRNTYVSDWYSIDGSFDAGISDGFEFIYPIRTGITSNEKPYQQGDEVKVLIRSMSAGTYDFIDKSLNQIANGGLFAKVLENVPSNLINKTAGNNSRLYGWFGTVAESSLSKTIP